MKGRGILSLLVAPVLLLSLAGCVGDDEVVRATGPKACPDTHPRCLRDPDLWAIGDNAKVWEWLLQNGANPNVSAGIDEDTPLHVAARDGSAKRVDLLLRHGAEVELENNQGDTPLIKAVDVGNGHETTFCAVDLLLKRGADVDSINDLLITPLDAAARRGDYATFLLLLQNGAKIETRPGHNEDDTSFTEPFIRFAADGIGWDYTIDRQLSPEAAAIVAENRRKCAQARM